MASLPVAELEGALPPPNAQSLSLSTPTVPIFARLPLEIIIAILSLFCYHCQDTTCESEPDDPEELQQNLAALSAVSKTCKWMKCIAQPILHHHFATPSNPMDPAQLFRFVRTLTERQDLANSVRILGLDPCRWFETKPKLDSWWYRRPDNPVLRLVVRGEALERMEQAANRFGFDRWPFDLISLKGRDSDSVHNSREWEDADGCIILGPPACAFLAQLAMGLCTNLKAVSLGMFLDEYAPWFQLPEPVAYNANVVRIRGPYFSARYGWGLGMGLVEGLTDSFPRVTTLQVLFIGSFDDVGEADNEERSSQYLTKAPEGLNLSFLFTYITMNHDFTDMSGFPTLRSLTLEHLPKPDRPYDNVYSSLQNFQVVEELYLGANGLFNELVGHEAAEPLSQILPPGIVVLHIFEARDWSAEVSLALIELLEDMQRGKAEFTSLKDIRVSFRPMWPWLRYYPRSDSESEDGEEWYLELAGEDKLDSKVEDLALAAGINFDFEPDTVPPGIQDLSYYRFTLPEAQSPSTSSSQDSVEDEIAPPESQDAE
ncbi:hypothetical protein C8A00DRAFT_38085 [Chaetomidium leptoderma]|uniref:Uncharacterized protein n=1 Tax=Chaetomidium leptoderma TaxID=669021 RepID=A0AAN6VDE6_9PEZI|nr:hypothetical protein C8A00DRAFT_38085 [Chaetomidium leptoderma]